MNSNGGTPIFVAPDGGERNQAFGLPRRILVSTAATGGAYCAFEETAPPGAGPPLHIHAREHEFFFVREGLVRFRCEEQTLELSPGGSVAIPPGARHTFKNVGADVARMVVTLTPGGIDGFFRDVEAGGLGPADAEAIEALAARFNVTFVAPPLD